MCEYVPGASPVITPSRTVAALERALDDSPDLVLFDIMVPRARPGDGASVRGLDPDAIHP